MKYSRHIKIPMNKKRNWNWAEDVECNKIFVETSLRYVINLYRARGYIYLNDIFRVFERKWNPYTENDCWISEQVDKFDIYADYSNVENNEIIVHIEVSSGMEEEEP